MSAPENVHVAVEVHDWPSMFCRWHVAIVDAQGTRSVAHFASRLHADEHAWRLQTDETERRKALGP